MAVFCIGVAGAASSGGGSGHGSFALQKLYPDRLLGRCLDILLPLLRARGILLRGALFRGIPWGRGLCHWVLFCITGWDVRAPAAEVCGRIRLIRREICVIQSLAFSGPRWATGVSRPRINLLPVFVALPIRILEAALATVEEETGVPRIGRITECPRKGPDPRAYLELVLDAPVLGRPQKRLRAFRIAGREANRTAASRIEARIRHDLYLR